MARSVRLALAGEFVPDAVNVQGGVVDEMIRPGLPLAEKLGRIFTALAGGIAARIDVEVRGEIAALDVSVLQLAALKGVFSDIVEDAVTYVNAPLLAAERGVEVSLVTDEESPDWRNVVTLRGTLPGGQVVSVGGTLTGPRQVEKLVEVNGFDMEISPAEHMVFFTYSDRPGVVGIVGQILGDRADQHRRHAGVPGRQGRARADRADGRLGAARRARTRSPAIGGIVAGPSTWRR